MGCNISKESSPLPARQAHEAHQTGTMTSAANAIARQTSSTSVNPALASLTRPQVQPTSNVPALRSPRGVIRSATANVLPEHRSAKGNPELRSEPTTAAPRTLRSAQLPPTPADFLGRKSIDLSEINAPTQRRLRSNSVDPQTMHDELPAHEALLDRGWGTVQGARIKEARPQIHPWERGVNPDLHVIPAGNPNAVDLKTVLNFEAMQNNGLLYMLAIDEQSRLRVAPETLLEGRDETGKERRLGHPALIEGAEDINDIEGHENKKKFRICGEIGWDAEKGVVYAMAKSGRYSRHPDRGPYQSEHLRRRLAACGLNVDMRPVPDNE
ncbi:hypothetical protein ACFQS6_20215 [Xanthomonas populi]|nr:hypothetical protein [Xanthomonas populi]